MPQLQLPIYPAGTTPITRDLVFEKKEDKVTYFHCALPVFSHGTDDMASFRMITAQFYVNGHATQAELARAFGVSAISLKRAVKCFREEGPAGFYRKRKARGAAVLTEEVLARSQQLLNEGLAPSEIADQLGIKRDTFSKAIRAGRLHKPVKKNTTMRS
jgi:hypothetical protein